MIVNPLSRRRVRRPQGRGHATPPVIAPALADASLDAMIVANPEGRVELWNTAAEALFGWSRKEATGKLLTELLIPPAFREVHQTGFDNASRSGHGCVLNIRVEVPACHQDGHEIPIELTITAIPRGDRFAFCAFARDLTERRAHAHALAESERASREARLFLRTVIDGLPDVVFIKDAETGSYILLNRAGERFFGLKEGEAIGRTDAELFGGIEGARIAADDARIMASGKLAINERTHLSIDGKRVHFLTHRVPLVDGPQNTALLLGVASDITPLRDLQEHLHHLNESLEETVVVRTRALESAREEVLERLGRAAGFRDDDTGAHIHRMSRYCAIIAREMGVDDEVCELLRRAAPMHDIGKIAIPDAILLKPGKLTPEEFETMRRHAAIGAEMLAGGDSTLIQTAEIVARCHHERWDGKGYPMGLAGEAIPLAGRIAAVADVFDALTSERPYKRAWSFDEAVAEIRKGAGTQFDPEVVKAFTKVLSLLHQTRVESSTEVRLAA